MEVSLRFPEIRLYRRAVSWWAFRPRTFVFRHAKLNVVVPFKLGQKQFEERYRRCLERLTPRAVAELRALFARPLPPDVKTAEVEIFVGDDDPYLPSVWIYYQGDGNKVDPKDTSIHPGFSTELALGLETLDDFDDRFFTDEKFGGLDVVANALQAWLAECWWKAGGWNYPIPVVGHVHDGFGDGKTVKLSGRESGRVERVETRKRARGHEVRPASPRPGVPTPEVSITQSGRGGSIVYVEDGQRIVFDWEFAMPPTLALIWGPKAKNWDAEYPWAAGRQAAVYDFVGTQVVKQKTTDAHFTRDLEAGTIDIIAAKTSAVGREKAARKSGPSAAYAKFLESVVPVWQKWQPGESYDVASIARLKPGERAQAVEVLTSRDATWREVEALAAIDLPAARAAVREALTHHLSIDTRLAAAEALQRLDPAFDMETMLTRQIRALNQPADGLERALRLAAAHASPAILQALLWSSYNCTDCAPACAKLLLTLKGGAAGPADAETETLLGKLGLHNSSMDRSAAFETLCRRVGMELDTGAAY